MSATSVIVDILARDNASRTFARVGTAAEASSSKLLATSKAMQAVHRAMFGLTLVAGTAAVAIVKTGADYVDSLNKIKVLTGASDAQLRAAASTLESNAGLYARMGQSTGDAAEGVVELTKAGLSLHKSLVSVNATMILAKAGEMSVAESSTFLSNQLNTFSLSAKSAGHIVDILANAANKSSADVSDLAESMKYVAPIAAQAGISVKGTAALLAELANQGIKGSQAGTTLRQMFLRIQAPTGAAAELIDQLGIKIFRANGELKPISGILDTVGKSLDGLTQGQRASAIKTIFGVTATSGVQALLKNGVPGFRKMAAAMGESGTAAAMANANSKGLMGTLKMLASFTESAAQAFYRKFSPALDAKLRPAIQWLITNGGPAVRSFAQSVGAVLGPAFDKMGQAVSAMRAKLQPVTDWMRRNPETMKAVATAIGVVTVALGGLSVAFALLSLAASPVTLVALAIAGLTAGIVIAYRHSEQFRQTVQQLGAGLSAAARNIAAAWRAVWPTLGPIAIRTLRTIATVIKGQLTIIKGVIEIFSSAMRGDWSGVWHGITDIFRGAWMQMRAIVTGAFAAIRGAVSRGSAGVLSIIRALPGKILGAVGSLGSLLFNAGRSIIQGLINGVESMVGALTDKLDWITSLIPVHKGPIEKDRNLLRPAGQAIMDGLIKGIDDGVMPLKTMLSKVTDAVQQAGDKLRTLLQNQRQFASGFQGFASPVFGMSTEDGTTSSVGDILRFAQDQKAQSAATRAQVNTLIHKGISRSLLKQLQASGSSGAAQIQALSYASKSQIARLNALNASTSKNYAKAGQQAGQVVFGDQIRGARGDLKEIRELRDELRHLSNSIGKGMHAEVRVKGNDLVIALRHDQRNRGVKSEDRVK